MEYYASLRTAGAIEAAEVAVVLLDAVRAAVRAGPAGHRRGRRGRPGAGARVQQVGSASTRTAATQLEREIDRDLARVAWAPRVNISAQTGRAVDKLAAQLRTSLASWDGGSRPGGSTPGSPRSWPQTPPPPRGGKAPRVLFATQADTRPPRFVLFTTGFLEAGYRRFLERRLREDFDFTGTPIEISVRVREKRGAKRSATVA